MICPKCKGNTKVTRTMPKGKRYRKCSKCGYNFKTYEKIKTE